MEKEEVGVFWEVKWVVEVDLSVLVLVLRLPLGSYKEMTPQVS